VLREERDILKRATAEVKSSPTNGDVGRGGGSGRSPDVVVASEVRYAAETVTCRPRASSRLTRRRASAAGLVR
jgi:hypothetical protein